jgi:hypothetical protein
MSAASGLNPGLFYSIPFLHMDLGQARFELHPPLSEGSSTFQPSLNSQIGARSGESFIVMSLNVGKLYPFGSAFSFRFPGFNTSFVRDRGQPPCSLSLLLGLSPFSYLACIRVFPIFSNNFGNR